MIFATAGHVDHGKTSLIKALSGTNTDRLPEEKARGLTIDIGFAYMETPGGQRMALIDVPGHEKFIRNMIAGVGLVDAAMLVVAADDGPMPQTLEHLAILKLMRVSLVIPVISKVDLVSDERVSEVINEVTDLLEAAKIQATEAYPTGFTDSSSTEHLKQKILALVESASGRSSPGYFRMAIDRCFTLDGSGTVVTGTVASGEVEKNQTLTLLSNNPSTGKSARVRGLHAQNAQAASASAGQRCAINLSGDLSREDLQRGSWLVENSDAVKTNVVDVVVEPALNSANYGAAKSNLSHWTPAHLHIGTADIPCRIALLDCTSIADGETALARLICDRSFTACHGDRFILRDQSAQVTIAGGSVLDVLPPRRGRSRPERLQQLQALNTDSAAGALGNLLQLNPYGVDANAFAMRFNLLPAEVTSLLQDASYVQVQSGASHWCLTTAQSEHIAEQVLTELLQYHKDNPDHLGIGFEQLHRLISRRMNADVLEHHLKALVAESQVIRAASVFSHADHQIAMNAADNDTWLKIESLLQASRLTPLRVVELAEELGSDAEEVRRFMNHCAAHGKVFKVTDNRYFLPQTLIELATMAESLSVADKLTVAEFRNQSGVGRNLVVELLEYFDRCRFTQRVGNTRSVLRSAAEVF